MAIVTAEKKKFLLDIKPEEITLELFVKLFGTTADITVDKTKVKKPMFNVVDELTLMPSDYFVDKKTVTTVGKFIYNKYFVEYLHLEKITGYVGWEMHDTGIKKFEKILSKALDDDLIDTKLYIDYINRRDNFGEQFHLIICPSFTLKVLRTPPKSKALKEKLLKENKEKLDAGDIDTANMVEKALLDKSREELKGDPGMQLYLSEARGSYNNNFKNINLLKGPIYNNITGKYDFITSNLVDGIQKKDIPTYGNAVTTGAFPKAVGTKVSGYTAKKLLAGMQTEVLDEVGSDCGTKGYIEVMITEKNKDNYMYRYIIIGSKLVELTSKNISSYVGKKVKMRSPMMCIGDKKCNICVGNRQVKMGIKNIGLSANAISGVLTNLNMKSIHDSSVKLKTIDPDAILI